MRRRWPSRLVGTLAALVAVVGLLVVAGPHQVRAYLTHLKGSPTHTEAYGPYPVAGEPAERFAVVGDVGDSGKRITATGAAVARLAGTHGWDALLVLGDNVYPRGDPAKLPDTVFGPFHDVLAGGARLLAILGNHDVKDGHGPAQMEALGMPGRWWSTTVGDVLVVGLDSTTPGDARQRAWLETTLREATSPWKVVLLHHPPYSAGYQGSSLRVRDVFAPLFERYGVQLVLSGHDHDYQRSVPIDGVTYIVSGGAAGTRRTGDEWFTARSFSWHHFVELAFFDDQVVVRAVNQRGRVADEAVIDRTPG